MSLPVDMAVCACRYGSVCVSIWECVRLIPERVGATVFRHEFWGEIGRSDATDWYWFWCCFVFFGEGVGGAGAFLVTLPYKTLP